MWKTSLLSSGCSREDGQDVSARAMLNCATRVPGQVRHPLSAQSSRLPGGQWAVCGLRGQWCGGPRARGGRELPHGCGEVKAPPSPVLHGRPAPPLGASCGRCAAPPLLVLPRSRPFCYSIGLPTQQPPREPTPGQRARDTPGPRVSVSARYSPACTGLGRSSPPSPRCGGRLEERGTRNPLLWGLMERTPENAASRWRTQLCLALPPSGDPARAGSPAPVLAESRRQAGRGGAGGSHPNLGVVTLAEAEDLALYDAASWPGSPRNHPLPNVAPPHQPGEAFHHHLQGAQAQEDHGRFLRPEPG